jgi:hypothetical protein
MQLSRCRAELEAHRPRLLAELRANGQELPPGARGPQACRRCGRKCKTTWLTRGVCVLCEDERRGQQLCPFTDSCRSSHWCPHGRRCFRCDSWACELCGLRRGDGDEVARLAAELQVAAVFLDFDHTVASTKHGANPLPAGSQADVSADNSADTSAPRHSVDPALLQLLCSHPGAAIVTRNSHAEAIAQFLGLHGVPSSVPVFSVKRLRTTKAAVVLRDSGLWDPSDPAARCLFVDDTLAEHLDPELAACPGVVRVLFSRT